MRYIALIFCLFTCQISYAQVNLLDSLLVDKKFDKVIPLIQGLINLDNDSTSYWHYRGKLHLERREFDKVFETLRKIDTLKLPADYKGWFYYILADSYRYSNQEEKAFPLKLRAQRLFREESNEIMENKVNYDLHYTLISQDFLDYDGESYLRAFFENAQKNNLPEQLLTAHLGLSFLQISPSNTDEARFHLDQANKYALQINTADAFFKIHNYKAVFHQNFTADYESATMHIDSMLYYANVLNSFNKIESTLKTKAYNATLQGDYNSAITQLLIADSLPISENVFNRKRGLYQYLALNYENLGELDKAYSYLKKMNQYKDSINITTQNTILTLLETEELGKKNLMLSTERTWFRNLLVTSFLILALSSVLAFFMIRNLKRKKLLAEKEKEIRAMDARIEERDKQRQRIASELHDNLGSIMVAIQLCFQNLKVRKDRFLLEEERLVSKARGLLDEAYQKIRNMAYYEDAASRRSEGLITSITDFVVKVSKGKDLLIDVHSHGMENALDAELENELGRITIELLMNAIKHAEASEISVDITKGKNELSIVVEDDGIGFDVDLLDKQKGLGLVGMEKQVERLNGQMTIDSRKGKGTTILIDIVL